MFCEYILGDKTVVATFIHDNGPLSPTEGGKLLGQMRDYQFMSRNSISDIHFNVLRKMHGSPQLLSFQY
jgi:hypothetical protein